MAQLEASLEDKPRATLATAAEDYGTSARDIRQVTTEMENEWAGLRATQTLMLLVDLLTVKIIDHGERDEIGRELSWPARELQRLRAVIEQRRREEVWPPGGQGQ